MITPDQLEFNYYPLVPDASNIVPSASGSTMAGGALQSNNYLAGSSGYTINSNGSVEFSDGTFRGTITANAGTIGGWSINATSIYTGTEDHSGYTANAGDITIYSDGTDASIHAYNWYIDTTGKFFSTSGQISGVSIATIPNDTNTDISLLEKTWTMAFTVTDANTIAWSSGTITFSNARTFSIDAGNTGNMAVLTYIYLDPAVSTTVLQTTTTAATALGANKSLIGTAQNNAVTASFIPYGPGQPLVDGANIGALSITAGNIAASTITAAKLNVTQLSAIAADLGTITAGTVTGATIQTAASGTRFVMTSSAFQGINSVGTTIFEVVLTGANEGDVIMGDDGSPLYALWDDSEGLLILNGYALQADIEYDAGTYVFASGTVERNTTNTTYTKLKEISVVKGGTITVNFDVKKGTGNTLIIDNFDSYNTADLNGQGSWAGSTDLDVQIDLIHGTTGKGVKNTTTGDENCAKTAGSSLTDGSQRCYMAAGTTNSSIVFLVIQETDGSTIGLTYFNSDGKVYYMSNNVGIELGATYSANTYYSFDVEWRSSDQKVRYRFNSNSEGDWTGWVISADGTAWAQADLIKLRSNNAAGGTAYWDSLCAVDTRAKIYVNGVGVGTERLALPWYVTYSENITIEKGDLVQIYAINAYVDEFKLKASTYEVSTVTSGYD